jgi:hypothetical protein
MLNEEKSASGGKNQNIVIMVLIAIIFAGAGFFGGIKYQQSQTQAQRTQLAGQFGNRALGNGTNGGNGANGANGAGNRGGFRGGQILGDIISVDAKSITVKLADGSSKIVLFSDTTPINQASAAAVSDLKVGDKVAAFGTANSDGSVTAQSIQLNPVMRGGFGDNNGSTPTPAK